MNLRRIAITLAVLLVADLNYGQSGPSSQASQTANTQLAGVWRGEYDGLPGIDMVISDEGSQLTGAILFYLHLRKSVNDPWTSSPGLPEPMLNLKFDGKTLRFQVSHRRAHPPRTLSDPPMPFHLTLTGPNKAELLNERDGPSLVMTRSNY